MPGRRCTPLHRHAHTPPTTTERRPRPTSSTLERPCTLQRPWRKPLCVANANRGGIDTRLVEAASTRQLPLRLANVPLVRAAKVARTAAGCAKASARAARAVTRGNTSCRHAVTSVRYHRPTSRRRRRRPRRNARQVLPLRHGLTPMAVEGDEAAWFLVEHKTFGPEE